MVPLSDNDRVVKHDHIKTTDAQAKPVQRPHVDDFDRKNAKVTERMDVLTHGSNMHGFEIYEHNASCSLGTPLSHTPEPRISSNRRRGQIHHQPIEDLFELSRACICRVPL